MDSLNPEAAKAFRGLPGLRFGAGVAGTFGRGTAKKGCAFLDVRRPDCKYWYGYKAHGFL